MKPVLNDKTVLRLQKATGLPVSRGVDKTINSVLDQLEELKTNNPETKNDEPASETVETLDCKCKNVEIVEEAETQNQKSDEDESQNGQ